MTKKADRSDTECYQETLFFLFTYSVKLWLKYIYILLCCMLASTSCQLM